MLTKIKKRKEAILYFKKAIDSNQKNELLHLSLYTCYAQIEELLEDLIKGFGTTYKNKIIFFAQKNNINIPKELKVI